MDEIAACTEFVILFLIHESKVNHRQQAVSSIPNANNGQSPPEVSTVNSKPERDTRVLHEEARTGEKASKTDRF